MSMPAASTTPRTACLEARLQSYGALRSADLEVLRACGEGLKSAAPGTPVMAVEAGDPPRLVVSGWAANVYRLPDGRRQILQIFLPGDVLGASQLRSDRGALALTGVTTSDARPLAAAIRARAPEHAALCAAWDRAQADREQQLLDHIVRLGRLSAVERTANLLIELLDRHRRARLSEGRRMAWPLTQDGLADVLGLSVVHVNRVLQQLRHKGLIVLRAGQLVVCNAAGLAATAARDAPAAESGNAPGERRITGMFVDPPSETRFAGPARG